MYTCLAIVLCTSRFNTKNTAFLYTLYLVNSTVRLLSYTQYPETDTSLFPLCLYWRPSLFYSLMTVLCLSTVVLSCNSPELTYFCGLHIVSYSLNVTQSDPCTTVNREFWNLFVVAVSAVGAVLPAQFWEWMFLCERVSVPQLSPRISGIRNFLHSFSSLRKSSLRTTRLVCPWIHFRISSVGIVR